MTRVRRPRALHRAVAACVVSAVVAAGCTSHPAEHATGPAATTPKPAAPETVALRFVSLKNNQADVVVLTARTGCRRIAAVHDSAARHDDVVSVTVAGPTDCARYPRVRRVVVSLRASGLLWCNGGKLIDASTGRPLPLAATGHWPVFSCPAHRQS